LPVSFYDRTSTGEMMSRLTYNIEMLADAAPPAPVNLAKDSLSFLVALGYLFYLNWQLAAVIILLAPPLSWLLRKINQLFRRYASRIQASMGDITRGTKEGLDGQRVIKAFNAQGHEIHKFDEVNERNRRSYMRLIGTRAAGNPIVQFTALIGLAGVV